MDKKEVINAIAYVVILFMMFDVLGFLMWGVSGQPLPQEGWYLGWGTYKIMSLVI